MGARQTPAIHVNATYAHTQHVICNEGDPASYYEEPSQFQSKLYEQGKANGTYAELVKAAEATYAGFGDDGDDAKDANDGGFGKATDDSNV